MFCEYCKAARAEDELPCPRCGYPSPLAREAQQVGGWQPSSANMDSTSDNNGILSAWGGPLSFDGRQQSPSRQSPFNAPPAFAPMQAGEQRMPQQMSPREEQRQAMLPVPYQGGMTMQNMPMQLVPAQDIAHMLPALPEEQEAVYIPPMYTKPRPIIPRYRAISGLISFLVIVMLLCGGAAYYAKASGRLDGVSKFLFGGGSPPANVQPATVSIPDPSTAIDKGKAYGIITAATTTLYVDSKSQVPRETDQIFKPGQTFFVTYSVHHPPTKGTVSIMWYSNGHSYRTMQKDVDQGPTVDVNGSASMMYPLACNGSVEIYWNNDLAMRLYFAVR